MTEVLKVKKLSENAQLPLRGTEHAAGFDLFAAVDSVVPKGGKALIMTDISIEIPQYTYARIAPRSGLAWKHFIDTGAGVIGTYVRKILGILY
jgi:dUTP pyrophosphatase